MFDQMDPPEVEEIRTDQQKLTIQVNGWTVRGLIESVTDRAEALAQKEIAKAIEETVTKAVEAAVDAEIEKRVGPVVDKILSEGWAVTDDYGRSKGVKSVKDYVLDALATRDSYSNGRTMIEKRMDETLAKLIDGALQKDLDVYRKKLRDQLDGVIASKVAETIKNAIGLK